MNAFEVLMAGAKRKATEDAQVAQRAQKRQRTTGWEAAILETLGFVHLTYIASWIQTYADLVYFATVCPEFYDAAVFQYRRWQVTGEAPFPCVRERLELDWEVVLTPVKKWMEPLSAECAVMTSEDGIPLTTKPLCTSPMEGFYTPPKVQMKRAYEAVVRHELEPVDACVAAAGMDWNGRGCVIETCDMLIRHINAALTVRVAHVAVMTGKTLLLKWISKRCIDRRQYDFATDNAALELAVEHEQHHLICLHHGGNCLCDPVFLYDHYVGKRARKVAWPAKRGYVTRSPCDLAEEYAVKHGKWDIWRAATRVGSMTREQVCAMAAAHGQAKFLATMADWGDNPFNTVNRREVVAAAFDAGQTCVIDWFLERLREYADGSRQMPLHDAFFQRDSAYDEIVKRFVLTRRWSRASTALALLGEAGGTLVAEWRMSSAMTACIDAGAIDCLVWGKTHGWSPTIYDLARAIRERQVHVARWLDTRLRCIAWDLMNRLYEAAASHTAEDSSPRTYEWLLWLLERYPPSSLDRDDRAYTTLHIGNNVNYNGAYAWLVEHGFPTLKQAKKMVGRK